MTAMTDPIKKGLLKHGLILAGLVALLFALRLLWPGAAHGKKGH